MNADLGLRMKEGKTKPGPRYSRRWEEGGNGTAKLEFPFSVEVRYLFNNFASAIPSL